MKRLPYSEGTWFAVPLRTGGYAIGVVARMAPKGKIVLAYFFGPKCDAVPALSEVEGLKPTDAIKCVRLGDLGMVNGEWPIIGASPGWAREDWPMPSFIKQDPLSNRVWLVRYADPIRVRLNKRNLCLRRSAVLRKTVFAGMGQ
ncbi:immunity 26/phosphotriesterase HocA family protein [Burkholderia ubonensis]|uniref:immunity 26/phosphotriesterase HocA family protein n=1 Tax=Burkholderia ubonensis TaxID=101571 RepID=UPI0018E0EFBD|nr:immunity 26/phosphotriesterase HocA family protein [Burkholderia ubonensis]